MNNLMVEPSITTVLPPSEPTTERTK